MGKPALPSRYEVERRGTPDPANADYYVLDAVNDFEARVALRAYVRGLRLHGKNQDLADEIEAGLKASQPAHAAVMAARSPVGKKVKTRQI